MLSPLIFGVLCLVLFLTIVYVHDMSIYFILATPWSSFVWSFAHVSSPVAFMSVLHCYFKPDRNDSLTTAKSRNLIYIFSMFIMKTVIPFARYTCDRLSVWVFRGPRWCMTALSSMIAIKFSITLFVLMCIHALAYITILIYPHFKLPYIDILSYAQTTSLRDSMYKLLITVQLNPSTSMLKIILGIRINDVLVSFLHFISSFFFLELILTMNDTAQRRVMYPPRFILLYLPY